MTTVNQWIMAFPLMLYGFGFSAIMGQTSQDSVTTDSLMISENENNRNIQISLWGEFYDESTLSQKDRSNFNSLFHIRQGFNLNWTPYVTLQAYLFYRYGKDMKRDFWNNRSETGIGFRSRFFEKVYLAWFIEYLRGLYHNIPENYPQPKEKTYMDFRTGLIFWYGWDTYYEPSKWASHPMIFWGDIYGDLTYYRKDRNNTIGYLQGKWGFHLLRVWTITIDGYAAAYLTKDKNKDYWNNYAEFGPGIWLQPWIDLDLKFYIEWLRGTYFDIQGVDPNPDPQQYQDRKIGLLFWLGW